MLNSIHLSEGSTQLTRKFPCKSDGAAGEHASSSESYEISNEDLFSPRRGGTNLSSPNGSDLDRAEQNVDYLNGRITVENAQSLLLPEACVFVAK